MVRLNWVRCRLCTMQETCGQDRDADTGDPQARGEIVAFIEQVLSDRPGEWRVSIVGSHANDNWEMKVQGKEGVRALVQFGCRCRGAPARGNRKLNR